MHYVNIEMVYSLQSASRRDASIGSHAIPPGNVRIS